MSVGQRPTAGTEGLRRLNTAAVLRALRRAGPSTRAELAQLTGLAKATVGVIVTDLEAVGAVEETAARPGTRGRPGRPVALRPGRFVSIGLELNVDYLSAVVLDLAGRVLVSTSRPAGDDDLAGLVALARTVREEIGPDRTVVGARVAVPALVRDDDRTVAWAPNLRREGLEVAEALDFLVPDDRVHVSNDANCAAYAEAHHGAAVGARHALYLTGTVGIGAGIVQDGEVVRGGSGFAGEVGHMPMGSSSARCGCGRRGCWEAAIGLHAMLDAVGMPELETPLATAAAVADRAASDPTVRRALAAVGHDLGLGVAVLSGVLDPEVVVLGGYFVPLGDLVIEPARRTLDERLASAAQARPQLLPSTLGIRAAALGAAEQSLGPVFSGQLDLTARC